jgi:hypothetical protein
MALKHKSPIRQSPVSAKADAAVPRIPFALDELPCIPVKWTATEQARIAELLAKEPAEPTPELIKALRAPRP